MEKATRSAEIVQEFRANQQILRVLEASKTLTDSIFDELPIVLAMVDDNARILKLNRAGQKHFNCSESKALGSDLVGLMSPVASTRLGAYFASTGTTREASFEEEVEVERQHRFYHWQMSQVYRDRSDGRRVHILIGHDMSEARNAIANLTTMRKDLEIASNIQSMLLPEASGVEGSWFSMAAYYEPSAQVGGDLWWYRDIPGRGLLAILLDVMGHGSGAAIAAASIAGSLNVAIELSDVHTGEDVVKLLEKVDQAACLAFKGNLLVSTVALWISEADSTIEVISLGFPSILCQPTGGASQRVSGRGNPIGLGCLRVGLAVKSVPFVKGDRVVCYTDGCYEFQRGGKAFGKMALEKTFNAVRKETPKAACERVGRQLREARTTEYAEDDLTFVIIERK